jgi:flagellar hook assembly protein FlgD
VTKISLNAKTKARAESWSLEIVSKSGQVVRRFGGQGLPPAHVLWDGKDETGMPVADGVYTYHLTVKDTEGRELNASSRKVEISTGGPQVTVPVQTNP